MFAFAQLDKMHYPFSCCGHCTCFYAGTLCLISAALFCVQASQTVTTVDTHILAEKFIPKTDPPSLGVV